MHTDDDDMQSTDHAFDIAMLEHAARLAVRGVGRVSPNPPVGCVIYDPTSKSILSTGWHTHYGGPHAEAHALSQLHNTDAANRLPGSTVYVTFEPCNHQGQTPACSTALIKAGIGRCVIGERDPHPDAQGGAQALTDAGIVVDVLPLYPTKRLTAPFITRITKGRPWVTIKWAQTLDGRIATRTGHSQWISNKHSRAAVHRLRARADAIITGIGTVIADDPMLTARNTKRIHRIARRIIIDWNLDTPIDAKLVTSAQSIPTTIVALDSVIDSPDRIEHCNTLKQQGVEITTVPTASLSDAFQILTSRYELNSVLVEAGAGLTGQLFKEDIVDELIVYVAPTLLADPEALSPARLLPPIESIDDAISLMLHRVRNLGNDVEFIYRLAALPE